MHPNNPSKLSYHGIKLIQSCERLELAPYYDSHGIATIGMGFTYYPSGKQVTINDPALTMAQAHEIFEEIIKPFEKCISENVNKIINQQQFDALVSLAYNIGMTAFKKSSLLAIINQNTTSYKIVAAFLDWHKVNGTFVQGLYNRRKKEVDMFFS